MATAKKRKRDTLAQISTNGKDKIIGGVLEGGRQPQTPDQGLESNSFLSMFLNVVSLVHDARSKHAI